MEEHDLKILADRAMIERGLSPNFPPFVLEEASKLKSKTPETFSEDIKDLRHLLWFSIDNDDSRDLDQITYAERLDDQSEKIYIAVANVASTVLKGSIVDVHAMRNTTSVYTPAKMFPMLPECLSTDATSLNPDQTRLAVVTEIHVKQDGSLGAYDIYPAWVKNHAKLAYNSVGAWIEGVEKAPALFEKTKGLAELVLLHHEISKKLKQHRIKEGALSFKTIETIPVIENGKVAGLKETKYNPAREIIEYFMISANIAATRYLQNKKYPVLRRVVRTPKNWDRIVELAASFGEALPKSPSVKDLQLFLIKRKKADPESFADLSLAMIKLIGNGEYVATFPGERPLGHFDLALKDYAHSTAPNRRYPDVILQRILLQAIQGNFCPYDEKELEKLAYLCTKKEDDAAKVERKMTKSAAAFVLAHRIGETFKGLITGASSKGTWVRLNDPPLEGKLVKGFQLLDVGDHVTVRLLKVDIPNGFIDFEKV